MDFKRKLGHGLSALFSSDEEIDQEIERMEREKALSQDNGPFSNEIDSVTPHEETSFDPKETEIKESADYQPMSFTESITPSTSLESSVTEVNDDKPMAETITMEGSIESKESVHSGFLEEMENSKDHPEDKTENPEEDSKADSEDEFDEDLNNDSDEESEETMDVNPDALKNAQMLDIYQIEPDRSQPRKSFDSQQLSELAASIKQYGIIQPILVSRKGDYYQIISGERRYRAARMAGLDKVPVLIRELDEQDKMALALIENIQRQELNPMEEANAYRTLMDKYQMTQEDIAEKLNKSRSSIANLLRLQKLPESVQKSLSEGLISFGHAKVLLGVDDPIEQTRYALQVVSNNLSVRELEDLIKKGKTTKKSSKTSKGSGKIQTFTHRLAEDRLKEKLSTKVVVNSGKRKGNISIEFYSQEDLERILSILGL